MTRTLLIRAAFCPVCGAECAHARRPRGRWRPLPHEAPCGRPCAGGGVSRESFLLGAVHRAPNACGACEAP